MKVLHLASFVGNVGDNASHIGLNSLLNYSFDNYQLERLEIRKFYQNYSASDKKEFNEEFIKYINGFDLFLIGGGGFLDYWVNNSVTGTTIAIPPDLVDDINVPTIISSVGCMPHKEVPAGNVEKFQRFLVACNKNNKIKIAVRNDGSIDSLRDDIGLEFSENIPEVLDNGFFFDTQAPNPLAFLGDYVAINITNDQLSMKSKVRGVIEKEKYLLEMVAIVNYIVKVKCLKVVMVPHIYADLIAINELFSFLDDFLIREWVTVAPCVQHDNGAESVFSIYKGSRLVIGSRFHANVCALAMNKPAIGLTALDRVKYVYKQLGLTDSCFYLDGLFSVDVIKAIDVQLQNSTAENEKLSMLKMKSKNEYSKIFSALGLVK